MRSFFSGLRRPRGADATLLRRPQGGDATLLRRPREGDVTLLRRPRGTDATLLRRPWGADATVLRRPRGTDATAARSAQLAELQRRIDRLHSAHTRDATRCPSGIPNLDHALGGGFASAAVHELLAPQPGAAASSVALLTAAHAALKRGGWIFHIDTAGDFYPPAAQRMGVPLGRMIVIRARRIADALWVCEQSLRCPAVAAVVITLPTLDAYVSRRLQLAAEAGGSLGLLIRTERRGGHTFAATRLQFEPIPGDTDRRRTLISVLKTRQGTPLEPFEVEIPDAAGVVHPHAVPADRSGLARRDAAG